LRPITVVAVGDLQLGDSPTTVGYGFYSKYRGRSLTPLFDATRPALTGADILFGNLETTLIPPPAGANSRGRLQLRGEQAFARALKEVGFTVLNVANNHAVQHGDETFHETVRTVRAAGIACVGLRGTDGWTSEPARLSIDGGTVGVLGYCLRPRQYGPGTPPYAEGDAESICADVRRLKAEGAIVIVSMHWGEEFVSRPSESEIAMGHAIIDAGAAAILGHHPHVTRPVELYQNTLIAHSLGNFMGDMTWHPMFRLGMVLRFSLGDAGVRDATVLDTFMTDDYTPIPAPGKTPMAVASAGVAGMSEADYDRAVDATIRAGRMASYRSAIVNLPRTPLKILIQLVVNTLTNKVGGLFGRA
jgi:poly-gamma-glutamate synthesis protein (capsule biosynthesis protein)